MGAVAGDMLERLTNMHHAELTVKQEVVSALCMYAQLSAKDLGQDKHKQCRQQLQVRMHA